MTDADGVPPEVDGDTLEAATLEELVERSGVDAETVSRVFDALAEIDHERRPWRDPQVLYELYYQEGMNQEEIAEHLGKSQKTISRWMHTHGIHPGRGGGGSGTVRRLLGTGPDTVPEGTEHDSSRFTDRCELHPQ